MSLEGQPYREMEDVIGAEEREQDAVVEFGRWRTRVKMGWVVGFVLVGVVAGVVGYWELTALQLRWMGAAWLWASAVVGFGGPFLGLSTAGLIVGRRVVRRRTGAALDRIAAAHRIERARLEEVARLVDGF